MVSESSSKILVDTATRLTSASTIEAITQIVTETARKLVGSDGATFVLKENDLCYYVDEDAISTLWKGKKFPMSSCISGWSMINKKSVIITDIYKDDRIPHDAYKPTFVKSLCMVLIRKDSPIGAIGNYWKKITHPSFEEVELLQILADLVSNSIENLELRNSVKDKVMQNENLKSKYQDLEAYIHSLAHDLKSPLTSLTGLSDLMLVSLGEKNYDKTKCYAESLKDCTRNLGLQVEKILGLYRASRENIQPKTIDFRGMVQDIIDSLMIQYPSKEVSLEIEKDLQALADPILLRIVMENLINNSFKFSQHGNTLKIKMGKSESEGNFSTFYVKDNGVGLDAADAGKLFKPLSRLHDEKAYPGLGLGLYSVSKIIELHGGKVKADGKVKEGSTFYFSLPTG
ncbi:MAG: GAF domain-containing sensor histidine kinase [Bdellovibrionota bacterium]